MDEFNNSNEMDDIDPNDFEFIMRGFRNREEFEEFQQHMRLQRTRIEDQERDIINLLGRIRNKRIIGLQHNKTVVMMEILVGYRVHLRTDEDRFLDGNYHQALHNMLERVRLEDAHLRALVLIANKENLEPGRNLDEEDELGLPPGVVMRGPQGIPILPAHIREELEDVTNIYASRINFKR